MRYNNAEIDLFKKQAEYLMRALDDIGTKYGRETQWDLRDYIIGRLVPKEYKAFPEKEKIQFPQDGLSD